MPFYYTLRRKPFADRAARNLLSLRRQIAREIPRRTVRDTLLLATWNVRDFDSNKFRHGPRLPESLFYIAEVISAFDLVAVQEVNEDLTALERVMEVLGPDWSYIATDVTEGSSGNRERMCFVYDARKVRFRNVAGEIVLPLQGLIDDRLQFARTPFLVSFQSGWFKFSLCTVHLFFGADSGEKLLRRIAEIDSLASFLAKRVTKDGINLTLLGDFNIVSPEHRTMEALLRHGFVVPAPIRQPTNMMRNRFYDQIAFKQRRDELQLGDSEPNAGAFNFYRSVFKPSHYDDYAPHMPAGKRDFDEEGNPRDEAGKRAYYEKTWRTFQMSDHIPLWVELKIDFSDRYLKKLVT